MLHARDFLPVLFRKSNFLPITHNEDPSAGVVKSLTRTTPVIEKPSQSSVFRKSLVPLEWFLLKFYIWPPLVSDTFWIAIIRVSYAFEGAYLGWGLFFSSTLTFRPANWSFIACCICCSKDDTKFLFISSQFFKFYSKSEMTCSNWVFLIEFFS